MRDCIRFIGVIMLVSFCLAWPLIGNGDGEVLSPDQQLELLFGSPDIKPGVSLTKVAGFVWSRQHLVEEFTADHIRVTLSQRLRLLPYTVDYYFENGKLTRMERSRRESMPEIEQLRRKDFDSQPWPLIDRSLWGYSFQIPPNWTLLHEEEIETPSFDFRFTVTGLPVIYDAALDAWVENSLQWCVFTKSGSYTSLDEVIADEEARLEIMGTEIVERRSTEDAHAFVYLSTFRGRQYLGKSYYFLSDGKGFAVRFNATDGTYSENLPRFERFIEKFKLTHDRADNPDIELIKDGNLTITIVGGAFTTEEAKTMDREIYRSQPAAK